MEAHEITEAQAWYRNLTDGSKMFWNYRTRAFFDLTLDMRVSIELMYRLKQEAEIRAPSRREASPHQAMELIWALERIGLLPPMKGTVSDLESRLGINRYAIYERVRIVKRMGLDIHTEMDLIDDPLNEWIVIEGDVGWLQTFVDEMKNQSRDEQVKRLCADSIEHDDKMWREIRDEPAIFEMARHGEVEKAIIDGAPLPRVI